MKTNGLKAMNKAVSKSKNGFVDSRRIFGSCGRLKALAIAGAMFVSLCSPSFASPSENAELYYVQLKNVVVPHRLLASVIGEKGKQAALNDSRLYVEVSRNGSVCWRSPTVVVTEAGTQEKYDFPQDALDTAFGMMWKSGDDIFVQVKVAENEALVRASTAGMGGVAGAAAGAAIGAVGAGVCTGGLGAPAGALIGAGIGFFGGAGLGAFYPVSGAREVVAFHPDSGQFSLNGTLETNVESPNNILITGRAKVEWTGWARQDKVANGELDLQKKYVVRLRSVQLSSKAPKYVAGSDYYMLVSVFGEDKPIKLDLGKLPPNVAISFENTLVLKNVGGESGVEIRRKKVGFDKSVFKAVQGATNGRSWAFCGKLEDDNGSVVEFDTFPAEQ